MLARLGCCTCDTYVEVSIRGDEVRLGRDLPPTWKYIRRLPGIYDIYCPRCSTLSLINKKR